MNEAQPLEVVPVSHQIRDYHRDEPLRKITTLKTLWDSHVALKGELAPNTIKYLEPIGRHLCSFFESREISPQALTEWALSYQEGGLNKKDPKKPASARYNRVIVTVRGFFGWLHQMEYTRGNYGLVLKFMAGGNPKESLIITEEEFERMKKYASNKPHLQSYLWFCILSYRTGLSLVDCCHLRWCDVHIDNNGPSYIRIRRIKTRRLGPKSVCHIPLLPGTDVWQWLMMLKAAPRYKFANGPSDFVTQDGPGLYMCKFSRIDNVMKSFFERSGVRGRSFRHFRNTFCSNLVNSDCQIALVCKMTGHSNVQTLLNYLRPDLRSMQDGLSKAFQFAQNESGVVRSEMGVAQ